MPPYESRKTEQRVLKFWQSKEVYPKVKLQNKGKKAWYFLDGPPYTSGHIHIGTAWNKCMKDTILRYKRLKGFDVWDRAGYDMHGLPTARKVQAKLGLDHKEDIEKYGVDKFVKECESFAVKNMLTMNKEFQALGVWMDFDNAYTPITKGYFDGEWWLIKQAEKNKRLYQAEKTMHWCKECSTALAKHELEYHNVNENSIFVKFKVKGTKNEYIIIWTTTPWTIPFNLGVMVHPELEYQKLQVEDEVWIVSKGLASAFMNAVVMKPYEVLETFPGANLKGLTYEHPQKEEIEFFKKNKNKKVHTVVLSSEYVDLSAGTGLVHMAPGCGPEDYEVGYREGIPPFNSLQENGVFPKSMGKFFGLVAKDDDKKFIEDLEKRGALVAQTQVEHEYAHCWRCKSPVIFRTTKQWFFKVEDLIPEMQAENKKIKWVPKWAGENWFNSWLEKLRDNSITRQRFWGTPLPVWQCKKCGKYEVIGSIAELKKKAGKLPENLHKPWIDKLKWKCSCGETMERIPDILDVWIDAGTCSWNCLDFPTRKDYFEKLYPADFILEGKDQIRGWFNLLLVASMVSMKKPSFKACYMHGFVQDSSGRKMSKSLGNIITPKEVLHEFGADTFRLYSIGAANPGLDLNYNKDDIVVKHKNLAILWNLHNYLLDYSKDIPLKEIKDIKGLGKEEKFILSKLNSTIKNVTKLFDNYHIDSTPDLIEELFLELSRTYIQLVRDKINSKDKAVVVNTIYTVLIGVLRLASPVIPFITEEIYQNLKEKAGLKEESIHLLTWPKVNEKLLDEKLEKQMTNAGFIIGGALNAREKAKLGVRWPLPEMVIVSETDLKDVLPLVGQQTNIKKITVKKTFDSKKTAKANFKTLGKKYGKEVQKVAALIEKNADKFKGKTIKLGAYEIEPEDVIIEEILPEHWFSSETRAGNVYIYTKLTKELEAEGFSREVVRRIQNLRKKTGLKKEDEVKLFVYGNDSVLKKIKPWQKDISIKCGGSLELKQGGKHKEEFEINQELVIIGLK